MPKILLWLRAALPWSGLIVLSACSLVAPPSDDAQALRTAVTSALREPANRARDPARHPFETLQSFELRPDQNVIEIAPGAGWYTEILAPFLRERGHLAVALYVDEAPVPTQNDAKFAAAHQRFEAKFATHPDRYGTITVGELRAGVLTGVGPAGSADAVLTFRNIHNWIASGHFDATLSAFYAVLKPGGVLGVEEHRAAPGTTLEQIVASGYVPEAYVVEHARAAGFVLVSRSEVNANPRDTKDHPNGVWSLPPTLRGGDAGREHFVAIGESDRMTLTLRKPLH
jgi:predicted methyltransferase